MACAVGRVEDLVVEDREVQGETKADGVSWGKVGLGNIGGILSGTVSQSGHSRWGTNQK